MRRFLAVLLGGLSWLNAADRLVPVPGTGLRVAVPADWREAVPERGAALALHQVGGSAGLAVTVSPVAVGTGPASFARAVLTELLDLGDGVSVLEHGFAFPIGVRVWSRIRYRLRIGPVVWEQVLWTTVEGERGVCVTGSADPAAMPLWLPVFERAIAAASTGRPVLAE